MKRKLIASTAAPSNKKRKRDSSTNPGSNGQKGLSSMSGDKTTVKRNNVKRYPERYLFHLF